MGPGDLAQALCGLDLINDPNLIVGLENADDAGVYRLRDDLAIIQTVDFFTPIVDDPFLFGQIAATNALSDVYAMGGKPVCAMNIIGFPIKEMDIGILREILRGGLAKLREAETALAGGHSVEDSELKYGLAVTGVIDPNQILTNQGALPGDKLVLTKPIGTGIINTAIKAEMAGADTINKIVTAMATLNRKGAEVLTRFNVHACTDVTGFGLLGHACEMIECAEVGLIIKADTVPVFPEAKEFASMGLNPAGLYRNKSYRENMVDISTDVTVELADILFDPQTSGGLMVAVPGSEGENLVTEMKTAGVADAAIIGDVVDHIAGRVVVR